MTGEFMLKQAEEIREQLVAWRRDIHAHPELSFQEHRTARLVADTLEGLGIEAQTGVAKTGVVGYLGEGTPVTGIRADMDALPILEANAVPYVSQNPGAMHACGHDAHTAMLLGVAKLLAEMPDRPAGQIRFLFQPSEEASDDENKSGGIRMVEEKALDGLDAVIALHVASEEPAGTISINSGYITAAEDSFYITLTGTGGHGAYPHQTVDPIFILPQVLNSINGIRARRMDPTKAGTISIGTVHAGTATNIIPAKVEISGTIRTFDEETRTLAKQELENVLQVARALGGDYTLRIRAGYPSTYNAPEVAELIEKAATDLLGADQLLPPKAGMGAEDFSYMTQKAPGAMFMLGAKYDDKSRPHHTPVFDISEDALPVGTAVLAEVTCRLLREHAK
ncbi:MAG: amidohydrolase [Caldilineaceae bacterium]|nr:amidohydrolase [Caldilineaceae bacterium]